MKEKRVLLMYITEFSGHYHAAHAIENALKLKDHKVETLNINAFHYTSPITEKIVHKIYMGVIKRTPRIWEYLYDNPNFINGTSSIKKFINKFNSPKLKRLFDRFKPRAIVCSQAFPCGMTAAFKKAYNIDVPLIGVLTDHAPHSYWLYDNVDYYVVPSQDAKEVFVKKGVAPERIKVLGIPIDPKFARPKNKERTARRLKLDLHTPIVLLMGGGQGIGPINKIIKYLDKARANFQIAVITGTNKKLIKKLKDSRNKFNKKITVFGYVHNVDELMEVSKLLITKAGGITTTEALAKGLPMIIIKPIPGQEDSNCEFLLRHKAAIKIRKAKEVTSCVERLINAEGRLHQMGLNARKISKPQAALDIAELILRSSSYAE
ncbi:MAG: glycosyltransferase [Candidatus Omnitrophota bacterium]